VKVPTEGAEVPIAFIQEFAISDDDRSTTNYDAINERLDLDNNPADGLIVHTAGWDEDAGVFRIFDVWESRDQAEAFVRDRLQPILEEGPVNPDSAAAPDREGTYELHDLLRS
jgi:hypothetical protein